MKFLHAVALLAFMTTAADAAMVPLKPGTYVLKGQPCKDPPLAALFQYDGQAFSYPHASQCRSTILSHKGRHYRLSETCSALGDSSLAAPSTTVSSYKIISNTAVRVGDEAHHDFRWCSP